VVESSNTPYRGQYPPYDSGCVSHPPYISDKEDIWSGPSGGWVEVEVPLGDAHKTAGFQLRFVFGSDSAWGAKGWLIDEHRFAVNGVESVVTIQAIRPLAQPVGAVFAWGLDDTGKWVRDQSDFRSDVAVLDLGFNTLDLFVVRGGQIDARYTGGETLGMRRAATIVVDMVRAKCQRELSLHEADQLVRQFINGKRTLDLTVADETFDIRNVVKTAVDSAAGRVLGYVERNWGNGRQFSKLLLVGGGCLALGPRLQALFRHATLLPDPVTANVRGMAKLAQRPGTFR